MVWIPVSQLFYLGSRHSIFKSGGRGKYFAIHCQTARGNQLVFTYLLKSVVEGNSNIPGAVI